MPDHETELIVAQAVVDAAADFGLRGWGAPVRLDDGSEESTADFVVPTASGEVALEITSIVDSTFVQTATEAHSRVEDLRTAAARRNAGSWLFVVISGAVVRDVIPELMRFVETETPIPGRSETGLPAGVDGVWYDPTSEPSCEIMTMSGTGAVSLPGRSSQLQRCVDSNTTKLSLSGYSEAYLAVDLLGMVSRDPSNTLVPELQHGVDGVFVVRRHVGVTRDTPVIWYSDGSREWQTNGETWE